MKIVFVSYHYWPPHFGGELKITIEQFQTLEKRGYSVFVLTSGVPGMPQHEIRDGLEVLRSPIIHDSRLGRGIRRLAFPIWASMQIHKMKFDVIRLAGAGGVEPISRCLSRRLVNWKAHQKGAKSVYVHCLADSEDQAFSNHGYKFILRNLSLKRVDAIVSVSPALELGVSRIFPGKSRLMVPGVHDEVFCPLAEIDRDRFREANQVSRENVVFSFLGSVGLRKGFDLLANAFLDLYDLYPNWHLWVIGPKNKSESQNLIGAEVDDLIKPLERLGNSVHFWGRVDDKEELAKILSASNVFVFPSRKEGFGLAPLEAMSAATPVIVSRIPGITDLANIEGETGLYCEVGNIESLKSAMLKLGTNEQLRRQMGPAARKQVVEKFGWSKYIDEWVNLYQSLSN